MIKKLLLNLFLISIFSINSVVAADVVPLTLIGKDSRSGMQINPTFEVTSLKTGLKLPIVKDGNYLVVKVLKGDEIQISAKADGYYPDEKIYKIDDEFSSDGRNIVFELDPQPAFNLSVEIKDKVNGKLVDGIITFKIDDELVKKIIIDKKNGSNIIVFSRPGNYSVGIISAGYNDINEELKIEVSDPPQKLNKVYELEKKQDLLSLKVVKAGSDIPITDVEVRIEDDKGNVLKNGLLENGSADLILRGNNKLTVKTQKEGYTSFSEVVFVDNGKLTIELRETSQIEIDVKDSFYNKNIEAFVEVTFPSGKKLELSSKANSTLSFIPTEKGRYQLLVTKKDYQQKSTNVNVTELIEKKYPLTVKLSSIYEDFLLWIVDENKKVIEGAEVRVIDESLNDLLVELNKTTNEWIVKLNKNNSYSFSATAEGYGTVKGELDLSKGKLIPILLKQKTNEIKIETIDKYTGELVKSTIDFEGISSEQRSKENTVHEIQLKQNQTIRPILSAKGYQTYQAENIENQTLTTVLMVAETYPITFEIVDALSNKKIEPSYFTLINKKTSEPINVLVLGKNVVNLNVEESYYIEIKKENYNDHSSPFLPSTILSKDKKEFIKTVKLSTKEFLTQTFKVINSETKLPIANPTISVKDAAGTEYKVNKDGQFWKVDLKNGEAFKVEVKAEGYTDFEQEFDNTDKNEIEILLNKIKLNELVFEAFDEVLEKQVPVKFSLLINDKFTDLQSFDSGVRAKGNLEFGKNYTIRISAPDYRDKENSFIYSESISNPLVLKFKKTFYPVKVLLEKTAETKLLGTPTIEIIGTKDKVKTTYVFDKQLFLADLSPDETYDLVLSANGFTTINEKVSLSDFIKNNLSKSFTLMPIVQEKVEEKLVEVVKEEKKEDAPKVEEPEPIKSEIIDLVLEKTTPIKPVKVETAYEKNKINLENIPEKNEELLSVLSSKDAIGKRYILTKVYFEQSSSKMKPASDEQLNSILSVLKSNQKLKVELVGHTDNVGDSRQNLYLSTFRAKVVGNFLFNNGIDNNRIIIKGLGDKFPVEPNDNEENKTKNRRVELIVIEN